MRPPGPTDPSERFMQIHCDGVRATCKRCLQVRVDSSARARAPERSVPMVRRMTREYRYPLETSSQAGCDVTIMQPTDHVADVGKMVCIGPTAKRPRDDLRRSRHACYPFTLSSLLWGAALEPSAAVCYAPPNTTATPLLTHAQPRRSFLFGAQSSAKTAPP